VGEYLKRKMNTAFFMPGVSLFTERKEGLPRNLAKLYRRLQSQVSGHVASADEFPQFGLRQRRPFLAKDPDFLPLKIAAVRTGNLNL
jgi:hypothetical protein